MDKNEINGVVIEIAREINRMALGDPGLRGNKCLAGAWMSLGMSMNSYLEGIKKGRLQGILAGGAFGLALMLGGYYLGKKKSEKSGK